MNGQIGVSAELGQGSTFAFFVHAPLVQQILKASSSSNHHSKADSGIVIQLTETPEQCTKTTLLVVEGTTMGSFSYSPNETNND